MRTTCTYSAEVALDSVEILQITRAWRSSLPPPSSLPNLWFLAVTEPDDEATSCDALFTTPSLQALALPFSTDADLSACPVNANQLLWAPDYPSDFTSWHHPFKPVHLRAEVTGPLIALADALEAGAPCWAPPRQSTSHSVRCGTACTRPPWIPSRPRPRPSQSAGFAR